MKRPKDLEQSGDGMVAELEPPDAIAPLLLRQAASAGRSVRPLVVTGELVATTEHGCTPLVLYPGQKGTAAVPARTIVDIDANHIGRRVLLLFESDETADPIVIGVLRDAGGWQSRDLPAPVEVHADGDRMLVSARKRLVLRCGMASITMTEEGKVLIQGTYVSSRSSGVHRIKGGVVHIN